MLELLGGQPATWYFLSIFHAWQFGDRKQEAVESSVTVFYNYKLTEEVTPVKLL